MQSEEKSF